MLNWFLDFRNGDAAEDDDDDDDYGELNVRKE